MFRVRELRWKCHFPSNNSNTTATWSIWWSFIVTELYFSKDTDYKRLYLGGSYSLAYSLPHNTSYTNTSFKVLHLHKENPVRNDFKDIEYWWNEQLVKIKVTSENHWIMMWNKLFLSNPTSRNEKYMFHRTHLFFLIGHLGVFFEGTTKQHTLIHVQMPAVWKSQK